MFLNAWETVFAFLLSFAVHINTVELCMPALQPAIADRVAGRYSLCLSSSINVLIFILWEQAFECWNLDHDFSSEMRINFL